MDLTVFCWNIFHGRDGPPDRSLYTRRAEWTRRTQMNESHVQVNRDLWREYTDMLCAAEWDVAVLQECPPRWKPGFARECGADAYQSLTSRNWFARFSWAVARGWPDLIGSSEGGSNMILARGTAGELRDTKDIAIQERKPERRTMAFARLDSGLCVTCLHASTSPPRAEGELKMAAEKAIEWAGADAPLVFGGDFNVRAHSSDVYSELERDFALTGITADDAIDHLLVRNIDHAPPTQVWPEARRELPQDDGRALRLSDHAPVTRTVRVPTGA